MDVKKIREQLQTDPTLRNRVARRAFELFIKRGRQMGREAEDWFRAEEEILQELIRAEQHRLALEAEKQRQEQAEVAANTTLEVSLPIAEESKPEEVTPKKRTYSRRKKTDEPASEVKTENVSQTATPEPTKPRARRTKKGTTAADLA